MSSRWVVFAVAWAPERAARMDTSLARVLGWLDEDGVRGAGIGGQERAAARQRAMAGGLKSQEAWLVSDVLVADARRLRAPGARVAERARNVTTAVQEALRALEDSRVPVLGSTAVLERPGAVLGRSEVERYAASGHVWSTGEDPVPVSEDLAWSLDGPRLHMRALPVSWLGVLADPLRVAGIDGNSWKLATWKFGDPRPAWGDDPVSRSRVMAWIRAFGWNGTPLRADFDDVERYLPTKRPRTGVGEHMAWLVPGIRGVGWCLAWEIVDPVEPDASRARVRQA